MTEKIKVLICGDVEGKFNVLFNRVESISKKAGPFQMLLCVGNFFGVNNSEFTPYQNGMKKIPISTYILGPNKEDHLKFYPDEEKDICENLHYLGRRGLYTLSGGLKIAYLSGTVTTDKCSNMFSYNTEDAIMLRDICLRNNPHYKGIDILLSSQWPLGVTRNTTSEISEPNTASPHCAWLAYHLRPRYHISGLEGIYYERPPFRNTIGDEFGIASRFIALARVGNSKKDKWIYAASLTPLDKMKISELVQKTTDETDCPYNIEELDIALNITKKKASSQQQQYFYDMAHDHEEESRRKHKKRPRIEFDQEKCWFCLGSANVEKHLVVSVGTSVYIAAAKGGIVDEHLLICPVEHHQSAVELEEDVLDEIERYKEALRRFYERNGGVAVFFERNYKTSHMQIQAIPVPKSSVKELKNIFMDEAEGNGFELTELQDGQRLNEVLKPKYPYFVVELPSGEILYTRIFGNKGFPINFGREVLASGPILNASDRLEWKDCVLAKNEETLLINRIRNDFEPYDISE